MFIVLALKLGFLISHAIHYIYLTKHIVKKKVAKAFDNEMLNIPHQLMFQEHFKLLHCPEANLFSSSQQI